MAVGKMGEKISPHCCHCPLASRTTEVEKMMTTIKCLFTRPKCVLQIRSYFESREKFCSAAPNCTNKIHLQFFYTRLTSDNSEQ